MREEPKTVSVIIPCYNEEDNVKECVERVPRMPWKTEIIVVDDGSTDGTSKRARAIRRKGLKVVSYSPNGGKGHAVKAGVKNATGDVVIIQDADMATPPEELPDMLAPIMGGKADFVNGSRLIYPMEAGAMKGIHVFGNRVFALLVSVMIRKRLTDTLCGFKAFKRAEMKERLKEESWPDFELIIEAKRAGMRIVEVPIHYKARKAGRSKMKTFSHGSEMFKMLLKSLF